MIGRKILRKESEFVHALADELRKNKNRSCPYNDKRDGQANQGITF